MKIVNPGGSRAFKYNARTLVLDEAIPLYGVTRAQDREDAAGR